MTKEPNETLVMTTCKCREHGTNLVMTRTWFDETLQGKIEQGVKMERERVIGILGQLISARPSDWELLNKGYTFERLIALIEGTDND